MRTFTLVGSLFAFMIDNAVSTGTDDSLIHYAITQGGLLAVVLVLIYLRQQDVKQQKEDNDKRHEENLERISILTDIAAQSATANTTNAAAARANADAITRLAGSVERFEKLPPANCMNFRQTQP